MSAKRPHGVAQLAAEVRELGGTARKTWRRLSRPHRYSLLAAVAVMVVHRLSTFADADRIFDDGCLLETGPYNELLARDGLFVDLGRVAETRSAEVPAPIK